MTAPAVHAAISACSAILMQDGIAKSRTASMGKGGNYAFRGIDEFMNACAPAMHKAGLTMVPRVVEERREEREKQGNGYTSVTFHVRLTMEFEFAAVADGSTVVARTVGEAMDSGDKATNKAMSAALKYCLMQTFMIPTAGLVDGDEENHQGVRPRPVDTTIARPSAWTEQRDRLVASLERADSRHALDMVRGSTEWDRLVKADDAPAGFADEVVRVARERWRALAA